MNKCRFKESECPVQDNETEICPLDKKKCTYGLEKRSIPKGKVIA